MRSAIVADGIVTNVILGQIEGSVPCDETVGIGWSWDGAKFAAPPAPEPEPVDAAALRAAIMDERNRRMRATLAFGGHVFDIDQGSLQRITGAATLAGFALGQGAQAGDLFWHGGSDPFGWITTDNQIVTMDAPTVFAFGQAAANHESQHIFAARALKDIDPIPDDWSDDKWWP